MKILTAICPWETTLWRSWDGQMNGWSSSFLGNKDMSVSPVHFVSLQFSRHFTTIQGADAEFGWFGPPDRFPDPRTLADDHALSLLRGFY